MRKATALFAALLLAIPPKVNKPAIQDKRPEPSLGFSKNKDISPVFDSDAYEEELQLEKKLPGNRFVYDKRAMHEAALMNDFIDGFKNSKECRGITFTLKSDKKPDFVVQVSVEGHDRHPDDQSWIWLLGWLTEPKQQKSESHGMAGMGTQSSALLAARDVCLTIWDDIDPNHFDKPGGKIE